MFRPAFAKIKEAHHDLVSVKATIDEQRKKARSKYQRDSNEYTRRIDLAKNKSDELAADIKLLETREQQLKADLQDIKSGHKVIKFIKSRVTDERYANSLGIISWVRRDFEQLDFLLTQQKAAQDKQVEEEEPEQPVFELERIILYIDDLDRCAEPTVIKVLEAMNLLLAFPLFVVVVGVDPRWMHNALKTKYPHLKNTLAGKAKEKPVIHATSSDYLEKIFQIPFALKGMTLESKAALITSQLETKGRVQSPVAEINDLLLADQPVSASVTDDRSPIVAPKDKSNDAVIKRDTMPALPVQPINVDVKRLLITEKEEAFMTELAWLIGDSPRTIKRYINIYRILRTHRGFRVDPGNRLPYYIAAMITLGVITGRPNLTDDFFELVKATDPDESFLNALAGSQLINGAENKTLANLLFVPSPAEQLSTIKMSVFKANAELIGRFSFSGSIYAIKTEPETKQS